MRRPTILLALLGAGAVLVRRLRAGRAEREVWTEATAAPDLR